MVYLGKRLNARILDEWAGQGPPRRVPGGPTEEWAIRVLRDSTSTAKAQRDAILELRLHGTEASVGALNEALARSRDDNVQEDAVRVLARIGSPAAVDALIAALGFSGAPAVRTAAIALGLRGERRASPALVDCVVRRGDELDPKARSAVLTALSYVPSPDSLDALAPLLRHRDRKTRRAAASAVAALKTPASLQALEAAAADLSFLRGISASVWAFQIHKDAKREAITRDAQERKAHRGGEP